MPARVLPPTIELKAMIERGMTHAQIADAISQKTGYPVSRSTVSAALHRASATNPAKKYPNEIPWTVREEHATHYAARMLRLLGRRHQGVRNSKEADDRLNSWLSKLEASGAVVVYVPETPEGFFYVQGTPDVPGIPVSTVEI